jgi:hypothetical protein
MHKPLTFFAMETTFGCRIQTPSREIPPKKPVDGTLKI